MNLFIKQMKMGINNKNKQEENEGKTPTFR